MAETESIDSKKLNTLRRRKSSQDDRNNSQNNHNNRIRDARKRRMSSQEKEEFDKSTPERKAVQEKSTISSENLTIDPQVSSGSAKDLHEKNLSKTKMAETESIDSNIKGNISEKRKRSQNDHINRIREARSRRMALQEKERSYNTVKKKTAQKKRLKSSSNLNIALQNGKENNKDISVKNISKENDSFGELKQKRKICGVKRNDSSEKSLIVPENEDARNITEHLDQNRVGQVEKDAMVMKWLQELEYVQTKQVHISGNNKDKSKRERVLVFRNYFNSGTSTDKEDKTTARKKSSCKVKFGKSRTGKSYSHEPEEISSNNTFMNSTNETNIEHVLKACKSSKNFKIHVSEKGKLQIILDLKLFSKDDEAIVIWLDDMRTGQTKFQRLVRTDVSNETQVIQSSNIRERELKDQLEEEASQQPKFYFPSVTIVKNVSVIN